MTGRSILIIILMMSSIYTLNSGFMTSRMCMPSFIGRFNCARCRSEIKELLGNHLKWFYQLSRTKFVQRRSVFAEYDQKSIDFWLDVCELEPLFHVDCLKTERVSHNNCYAKKNISSRCWRRRRRRKFHRQKMILQYFIIQVKFHFQKQ